MSLASLMPRAEKPKADAFTLMQKLDLTYAQAVILLHIWESGSVGLNTSPPIRALRQHIYKIRPRLAKHGIFILGTGPGSYGMPQQSRKILEHML